MRNPLSSDRRQFRSSVMYAYLKGLALLDLAYLILTIQLCYFVLNSHMWFDPQDSPDPKDDQLRSFIRMVHRPWFHLLKTFIILSLTSYIFSTSQIQKISASGRVHMAWSITR